MKIINLDNGIKIKSTEIKKIRNKPKKLYAGFGKEIRADYCLEFYNGTFMELTKQQYKMIKKILRGEEDER